ncbi:MAG: DNA polymerase III subunit chi [Novosphingobium sp.]
MRVDFYQLSRDPVEAVLPAIARNTLNADERLLVVSGDPDHLERIGVGLWNRFPESFLAHGKVGGAHDAMQPILLSHELSPGNGARYCALADGVWREAEAPFARMFLLFDDARLQQARECWRMLATRDGAERHFWKQDAKGRWAEAG